MQNLRHILFALAMMLPLQHWLALRAVGADDALRRLPVLSAASLVEQSPGIGPGEANEITPPPEDVPTPSPAHDFPALPPDPYDDGRDPLPPLEEELFLHGGSYLYAPEGDHLNWPPPCTDHYEVLRLPEWWEKPRPLEGCAEFLGADPIKAYPHLHWPNCGYDWEPRFVGYGGYQVFGLTFDENGRRQTGVGHQLLVDLDYRLTGTERFHVQFRPLGERNTGGSFYQLSDPAGYISNGTVAPDRYWFEGEIASIFGGCIDPFAVADVHFVAGRFPFFLHNNLLMNTDLLGAVVNKNTIFVGDLSNLNVQLFAAREDIAAFADADGYIYGANISADRHHAFWELTYAFLQHESESTRDAHYVAISRTQLYGAWVVAARALARWGDADGDGDGQLFVIESNRTHYYDCAPWGVESSVLYCNAFYASDGWRPISGGNFNRLRSTFEVNPLVSISAGNPFSDVYGAALGVQLFRHHEDESIIPEIAFQSSQGRPAIGCGVRYLRKTSARSFFEVLGVYVTGDAPEFDRDGVFVSETILF